MIFHTNAKLFTVRVETPSMSRQFTYRGTYRQLVKHLSVKYPTSAQVNIK